ncbi:9e3b286c-a3e7-465c-bc91-14fb372cc1ff-CDS [Sclerotinia trifoliorum]|uniref:9e3b286c-a3e7-465c-bc91-14fb372cc1ff-CDS n=1 Tax=Sclerotinia trifoliorum TaxID=28548 RepID=A0A8H2VTS1_9HELO|nr:9e3b286c-a3e7-465c-bc91-14fb372cc1ff-CDS [Sclerotinia trifoliorum]
MIRGVLVSAIYHKTTQIGIGEFDNATAVTLMSADTEQIMYALRQMHELWANIIKVGLASWLLYTRVGFACFAPLVIAAVVVLLHSGSVLEQIFTNASGCLSYNSEWLQQRRRFEQ